MSAAAWIRRRGVGNVGPSRGILLIFTLLSLVCFASSIFDQNELRELKKQLQKLKQDIQKLKALHMSETSSSDDFSVYLQYMESIIALIKKLYKDLPADFPPADALLDKIRILFEKTKTYINKKNEETAKKIDKWEKELESLEKIVNYLEKLKTEL